MRILHIGNGNQKHAGAKYYDVGTKLNNGFIRNGHNVFFISDRDIARNNRKLFFKNSGEEYCNEYFLKTVKNFQPALVVLGHADIITAESLHQAKKSFPALKIAQWNVDPVFRPVNIENIKSKLSAVDATFITTAGSALKKFSSPNGVVCYMPNPVDSSIEWPECHKKSDQPNDVFWALRAINGSYEGDPRIELPLYLEQSSDIKIDYHGMNGKAELFGADYYNKISESKMGLNISVNRTWGHLPEASDDELYLYSSDRISHYMGSGLLTFSTRGFALEEMFVEDTEMVFFDSKEELRDKIIFYKNNDSERKRLATAGWQKSHKFFNESLIAKYIIETTMQQNYTEKYFWPLNKF